MYKRNVIRCIKGTSALSTCCHIRCSSMIGPCVYMMKFSLIGQGHWLVHNVTWLSHWIRQFITWPGHMTQGPLYALPPKARYTTWRLELNCEHLHLLDIECWLYCWTLYLLQLILLDFVIIATYIWWTCFYGTCILWTYICNWYGQYMYQLPVEELVLSFVFMQ